MLTQDVVDALQRRQGEIEVLRRDVNVGLAFVDEAWIGANFTAEEERSQEQRTILADSDRLVEELQRADVLVIGAPIYNFGVPAALKAWIDMIARVRKTFRYTENGPEGLLKNKKAYVVIASGGVPVDSSLDFATPYLKHALRFIGITDVEVIAADQLNINAKDAIDVARTRIADLIYTPRSLAERAA
jgi:FMN-dependent NADH-azoreductase